MNSKAEIFMRYLFCCLLIMAVSCTRSTESNLQQASEYNPNVNPVIVSGVTMEIDVNSASDIFIATIISAKIIDPDERYRIVEAQYRLVESIKGVQNNEGVVRSSLQNLGLQFTVGRDFLIVQYGTDGTGCCSGSTILHYFTDSFGDEEREYLEKIRLAVNPQSNRSGNQGVRLKLP